MSASRQGGIYCVPRFIDHPAPRDQALDDARWFRANIKKSIRDFAAATAYYDRDGGRHVTARFVAPRDALIVGVYYDLPDVGQLHGDCRDTLLELPS